MTAIWVACVWLIAANLAAIIPSSDNHWRRAYILISTGAPLAFWLVWSQGWIAALIFLGCCASVLRWPLLHFWRWTTKKVLSRQK